VRRLLPDHVAAERDYSAHGCVPDQTGGRAAIQHGFAGLIERPEPDSVMNDVVPHRLVLGAPQYVKPPLSGRG
jgi:hypothetical protein